MYIIHEPIFNIYVIQLNFIIRHSDNYFELKLIYQENIPGPINYYMEYYLILVWTQVKRL